MPTGYTSDINEGKEVTRNDFIMGCARAFGALIEMRDLPNDAPIPEFQPSKYAIENLERATKELNRLDSLTDIEAIAELEHKHQKNAESDLNSYTENVKLLERYNAMITEVRAWTPPTTEHEELKNFCLKQLSDSIEWDCSKALKPYVAPVKPTLETWLSERRSYYIREIEYYEKDHKADVQRVDGRNKWVRDLRDSL